jgi:hypothetical protein
MFKSPGVHFSWDVENVPFLTDLEDPFTRLLIEGNPARRLGSQITTRNNPKRSTPCLHQHCMQPHDI